MQLGRWLKVGALMTAIGGAASACGGNTTGGRSAQVELEQNGTARCADACETVVRCDLGGSGCDCACDDAPGGCAECECEPPSVAECTARCSEEVDEVLSDTPDCAPEMLALINCVRGATCSGRLCEAEQERLEACTDERDGDETRKVPPSETGVRLDCDEGFGSASPSGPHVPGSVVCDQGLTGCADGTEYRVECRATSGNELQCVCLVNEVPVDRFAGEGYCGERMGTLNAACGWGP